MVVPGSFDTERLVSPPALETVMSRGATLSTLAFAVLVAAAGCGTSSPSDPDPPDVASIDVTPTSADILVGETVQLTGTPKGPGGETLTGRSVTWSSANTAVATVSSSGLVTGVAEGTADITATSEGRSGSAQVTVSPVPVATVELDPAGPVDVFTGGTVQFTATTKDAQGNVLTGRTVTWSTDPGTVASVDSNGLVTGEAAGSAEVTATSEGVSTMATVNVTDPGPVSITQVSPGTVVEGQTATITGSGFDPTASLNTVTVDGVEATVTQSTATTIDITVPFFACRPKRAADVVVSVGAETSPPEAVTVSPASLLSMAVGDRMTLNDPANLCLQFDDEGGAERYLIGVQSVSEVASTLTGVRVDAEAGAGPAPRPLPAPHVGVLPDLPSIDLEQAARLARQQTSEMLYMERARALIEPIRRANTFQPTPAYRAGPAMIPGDVMEGTEVTVRFPDFNGDFCNNSTDITAIVRKVSTRAIIVEDKDNPAGGFTSQDFDDIAADFDGTIYATDVAYFGDPTDMDSNSRIVIFFTKAVNELDGPAGFAGSVDLVPASQCAASNEGEYFYARAPDPTGAHGDPFSLDDARLFNRSLVAHEFAHIIQLGRRLMAPGGLFMTSFMAEGGATAAEQYSGFVFEGRSEGQNYDATAIYQTLGADPNGYYLWMNNFPRYFGFNFSGGRNAGAPEQCTWVGGALVDIGPCSSGGLLPYGITFSLLQHAIEHYGDGLGGPQAIHRAIVDHTGSAGFSTLEAVFGVTVAEMMASWAPMLYIDDRFADPGLADFQFLNWDLRSVEAAWGSEADLRPRARGFGSFTDDVSVRSASTAFFDVSGAGRPATAIEITDQAGEDLPGTFQVFIVRVE